MDFVVGIEIKLSNNHTVNGMPLTDICDTLKGRYPKDFKFVGWHPHCRCHVVTILKTEKEMMRDTQRILNGEQPLKGSVNTIKSVPSAFKDWVEEHSDRIEKGGKLPYFIADNRKHVNRILGISPMQEVNNIIRLGDHEWSLDDLISECRIEPTENGKIYVHPEHGKSELAENLEFARWRAEQFGEEIILLPNPNGVKSADSYNITRHVQEEYKRANEPTKNAISQLIRNGNKQAQYLIVEPHKDITVEDVFFAIKSRIHDGVTPRCSSLKEIRLKIGEYEAVYSRNKIVTDGFKIRLEDFRNVSASQNWGLRPSSKREGTSTDAKLAKFFELNKKSPKEIAIERHAKRDAAKIQHAWNKRRISNLAKAVKDGYLPKESLTGLSELKQDAFNTRVSALQKAANRHEARNTKTINEIKERWTKKQKRDATTRLMANNVLKVAQDWQEVDFSVLEKIIANNNLGAMRAEAKNVAQAIKAIRDEEKALADLIPDAHGWHKQFGIAELREAHGKIQSTLDYWKAKGYDLATDSNLDILKKELEQKIKFVENPGAFKAGLKAHKTWQVQKQAYEHLLGKVETRIEIIKLETDYQALLGFKTTSKDFKEFMAKAKATIDAGDVKTAKFYLNVARSKKSGLEKKRTGKATIRTKSSSQFDNNAYTKERKDNALWFGGKLKREEQQRGWNEADRYMSKYAEENWKLWTNEQKHVGYLYTSGSRYINEPLFGKYIGVKQSLIDGSIRDSWKDINTLTEMIDKTIPLEKDMWKQHGEDMKAFMGKFGVNLDNLTDAQMNGLVGKIGTNKPFTSCGCSKYSGFESDEVLINIYCPAGTKGIYTEPYSHYGDSGYHEGGYKWNGKKRGRNCGYENEFILQRGSVFRITKIEKGPYGKWYVDCELIEQPAKKPNVI